MSAASGSNTKHVYVRLLGEGTEVYRPVEALPVTKDTVRLLDPENYDGEDEDWEFKPGSVVRLKPIILEGKEVELATGLGV